MTQLVLKQESLAALKDKVVVISGSARGIGRATVFELCKAGANVVHGDWEEKGGRQVDKDLLTSYDSLGGKSNFIQTDVTSYDSILNLFQFAFEKYGRIDLAISNAGIQESGNLFDPSLDLESVKLKPTTRVIDVNLTGTIYFSRIAVVYLKESSRPGDDKSLVLISSVAGFKESPGLFVYQASKHGVLGLLRSLRLVLPKTHGIRVNAICPWMTDTVMVEGIKQSWLDEGLPVNTPADIARNIIEVGCCRELNGRAIFVEGGRGWDVEEGIDRTEPLWLGEKVSKNLARGQEVLGDGTDWTKPEPKS